MKPPNTQSYSPPLPYHPDDKWYIFELPILLCASDIEYKDYATTLPTPPPHTR